MFKRFFNQIIKALIFDNRFTYNKIKAKKSVICLCYIIAKMKNKFVINFKLKIRLYLLILRISYTIIDIINSINLSFYYIIFNNYKQKFILEYSIKIREFFLNK